MRRTLLLAGSALALAMASTAASAQNNDLFVEQAGNFNFANGNQVGNTNESYLSQQGNKNAISASTNGARNDVLIVQTTNRNFAGGGGDWTGNDNQTAIIQGGGNENIAFTRVGVASNDTLGIIQNGTSNLIWGGEATSFSINSGMPPNQASLGTLPDIASTPGFVAIPSAVAGEMSDRFTRNGVGNTALLEQQGSYNQMALTVNGNNNEILGGLSDSATDTGVTSSLSLNGEIGGGSTFFAGDPELDETDGSGPFSTYLASYTDGFASQTGSSNVAHLAQVGSSNSITFDQIGGGNTAQVYQIGFGNGARAGQYQ